MRKHKQEFSPLFAKGFHNVSIDELRNRCVVEFPEPTLRKEIMAGFETIYERAMELGIEGQFWIDGSFTTKKLDPEDIDFILITDPEFRDNGTAEQKEFIEWLINNERDPKLAFMCDTDVVFRYPENSPWFQHFTGSVLDGSVANSCV